MPRRVVIASVVLATALTLLMSGCSPIVAMNPAPNANDPGCADVIVRLPDTLENLPKRETNAQSTGAWGDPTEILLRCGVTVPTVSDLPCVQTDDFYWLRDDSKAPTYVFTTYGRTPAVAVVIDQRKQAPGVVLSDLENVLAFTKPNGRKCLSVEDSLGAPTPSPTPTPLPTATPSPTPSP